MKVDLPLNKETKQNLDVYTIIKTFRNHQNSQEIIDTVVDTSGLHQEE